MGKWIPSQLKAHAIFTHLFVEGERHGHWHVFEQAIDRHDFALVYSYEITHSWLCTPVHSDSLERIGRFRTIWSWMESFSDALSGRRVHIIFCASCHHALECHLIMLKLYSQLMLCHRFILTRDCTFMCVMRHWLILGASTGSSSLSRLGAPLAIERHSSEPYNVRILRRCVKLARTHVLMWYVTWCTSILAHRGRIDMFRTISYLWVFFGRWTGICNHIRHIASPRDNIPPLRQRAHIVTSLHTDETACSCATWCTVSLAHPDAARFHMIWSLRRPFGYALNRNIQPHRVYCVTTRQYAII